MDKSGIEVGAAVVACLGVVLLWASRESVAGWRLLKRGLALNPTREFESRVRARRNAFVAFAAGAALCFALSSWLALRAAWIAQRVGANSAGAESSCDPILSGGVALFGLLFFTGSVSRVLPGRLWKEWPYAPWTSLGVGSTLLLLAWLLYVGSCLYPEGSS